MVGEVHRLVAYEAHVVGEKPNFTRCKHCGPGTFHGHNVMKNSDRGNVKSKSAKLNDTCITLSSLNLPKTGAALSQKR